MQSHAASWWYIQYSNLGAGPVLNSATYSKDDSQPLAVALCSAPSLECKGTFSRRHKSGLVMPGWASFPQPVHLVTLQTSRRSVPALVLSCCVTLGNLLHPSVPAAGQYGDSQRQETQKAS